MVFVGFIAFQNILREVSEGFNSFRGDYRRVSWKPKNLRDLEVSAGSKGVLRSSEGIQVDFREFRGNISEF